MKGILLVTVLIFTFGIASGQGFSIGANIGGGYHSLNPDEQEIDNMSGIGYGGGVVLELDMLPTIGAEVDVQYAIYNYKWSGEIDNAQGDITLKSNNLVVPVLLKYKMAIPTFSPYFVLGPSLIKNLSGSVTMSSAEVDTTWDVDSEDLETDFGIQVGAGANLGMMQAIGISPYVRFQYNLTGDMEDTNEKESMYDILFGVNFMYRLK
jgi:hypothetical protein